MPVIICVLSCHFLAAFSVLGMPLFLPRMLAALGSDTPDYLVGILFALPSVCTALAAPLWGRFADRYGKRLSLLRAQLGLMIGFLMAGFADSVAVFSLGLLVQGLCGGTLAASHAYLAVQRQGRALAGSLNLTQVSARLALICGPIVLGLFTQMSEPLAVYRYLAILPGMALCLTLLLPVDRPEPQTAEPSAPQQQDSPLKQLMAFEDEQLKAFEDEQLKALQFKQLMALQFLFCFSMVVTFPYFLPYAEQVGLNNDSLIGLMYSLPHVLYILLIVPLGRLRWPAYSLLSCGLCLLLAASLMQFVAATQTLLLVGRVLFGLGTVLGYCGIHQLFSERVVAATSGTRFGKLDASGKWAGFAAGMVASGLVSLFDYRFTFVLAMLSASLAVGLVLMINKGRTVNENATCV